MHEYNWVNFDAVDFAIALVKSIVSSFPFAAIDIDPSLRRNAERADPHEAALFDLRQEILLLGARASCANEG